MSVSCGALEVGEIWTILFGIATDCAIGIVALEAISPISTLALSDLTSFVAASTDALACVCPSSEPTSVTWIDFERPSALSAAFWSDDRLLDGTVEVRPVRREVAGERQHVADPERERAVLGRRGRARIARRADRDRDGERQHRHARDGSASHLPHENPSFAVDARNVAQH